MTERTPPTYEELATRVAELERMVAALQQSLSADRSAPPIESSPAREAFHRDQSHWTRRALLFGGAAAAAGGVAGLTNAAPAAAATGTMVFGATNDAGSSGTTLKAATGSSGSTMTINNTGFGAGLQSTATLTGVGDPPPAVGATGSGKAWGLRASAEDGYGVHASSTNGSPLRIDCPNRLQLPGTANPGDFIAFGGALWFCVQGGTPARWRLLASPSSAGAFVPIPVARVYDSRFNAAVNAPRGAINSGTSRKVSVATAFDPGTNTSIGEKVPTGARAVALNVTVVRPVGGGGLFVGAGNATTTSIPSVSWSVGWSNVSNAAIVGLDTARQILVAFTSDGGFGSTNVTIDVTGYYLGA